MMPRVVASIDLSAISFNAQQIAQQLPQHARMMAMVKANAYGHGLVEVASALTQAHAFGVATLDEALSLRHAGIDQAIFVMCGFRSAVEIGAFEQYNLTAIIHHLDQLDWLLSVPVRQPFPVWLKVDTGMHRLGVSPDSVATCIERLLRCACVQSPIGLMTHLATADLNDASTRAQLTLFNTLTARYQLPMSVINSAGVVYFPNAAYHLVRPGIMLYGVSPIASKIGADLGLKPAMRLTSYVVSYRDVGVGERVGYGGTWCATTRTRIAIVTAGYGDGYPRHAPTGTPVLVNGICCPIAGRISMDMLAIDVTQLDHVRIGDEVVLWGPELPVERIAYHADTIPYELLCQLTDRVTRQITT